MLISGLSGKQNFFSCNGTGTTLAKMIGEMAALLKLKVTTVTDPALVRPSDNSIIIESNKKLKQRQAETRNLHFKKSVEDIMEYWNNKD